MSKIQTNYYILIWVFSLCLCLIYPFLRIYANKILRDRKISKTSIEEMLKGKRNYWFYEAIHANYNIGAMYYANKVFIKSVVLTIGLHIFLGWIPKASVVISLMLSIACISFSFFAHITVVAWQKDHRKKRKNGVTAEAASAIVVFPILMLLSVVIYTAKLWLA